MTQNVRAIEVASSSLPPANESCQSPEMVVNELLGFYPMNLNTPATGLLRNRRGYFIATAMWAEFSPESNFRQLQKLMCAPISIWRAGPDEVITPNPDAPKVFAGRPRFV